MVVHAILAVAAAAATPSNVASPAENLLSVDAAFARWDMDEVRILAQAMPKGAERCAVEGIIATRDNRLEEVSKSLPDRGSHPLSRPRRLVARSWGWFHPELSGRDNIFLSGAVLGMRERQIREKLEEIVDFSEVGAFIDTPVKRYPSGMYLRLAFAVAAHLETDILLLDEVLAVGDAAFQKKCLDRMDGVARQGRTILFVTHNLTAVRSLCNRDLARPWRGGDGRQGRSGDRALYADQPWRTE